MDRTTILTWLHEEEPARLNELWRQADSVRRANVGDAVHLRGLVEISSHCIRQCGYCGLRLPNRDLARYRMSDQEILQCASLARDFGYGTVVLQAGEDPGIEAQWMADLIAQIKADGDDRSRPALAVTLSLGERSDEELQLWRRAGADRYLLRFETSNRELFDRIHPSLPNLRSDRIAMLRRLGQLGYEVGSGVMIGIPGQSYEDLANDIELFATVGLDMIGVGPYLPHPQTPMGQENPSTEFRNLESGQVPNSELMTYKMIALTRLACPKANIPSTTALATLNRQSGREQGLMRGANIVMPNLTPPAYRALYEIYPAKACLYETAQQCHGCMLGRIESIGRTIGAGRGDSPNKAARG